MQQVRPKRDLTKGTQGWTVHPKDSGSFAQTRRQPSAEPDNKEGDQRVCPTGLHLPS